MSNVKLDLSHYKLERYIPKRVQVVLTTFEVLEDVTSTSTGRQCEGDMRAFWNKSEDFHIQYTCLGKKLI